MAPVRKKNLYHLRPTVAQIDLSAISYNLEGISKKAGAATKIMAVVKANAYGHGAGPVARSIEKKYADYFGVAIVEEGIALREAGVTKPILVFTPPQKRQVHAFVDYGLEATVSSVQDAEILESAGSRLRKTIEVHLKLETGMNRLGMKQKDLDSALSAVAAMRRVGIKGAFTHFATADDRDKTFTLQQFEVFQNSLSILRRNGVDPDLIHCANSAAILEFPQMSCSMVRPGISMYGHYPSRQLSRSVPLRPAMSFMTTIAFVKSIDAGESVSYGRRFVASKRTRIATLPVGYADGYSRLLTGKASVLVGGRRFPVVGTICMDMIMVDVGDADVAVGDEAILMGRQNGQEITCWDIAERVGTIPYEILCGISARVPRIYTK
ncbi:MAG TPA: alanine racemase [Bacteroidota bacterium]|nr:alanine racemase [Bacteroidota bacterium]